MENRLKPYFALRDQIAILKSELKAQERGWIMRRVKEILPRFIEIREPYDKINPKKGSWASSVSSCTHIVVEDNVIECGWLDFEFGCAPGGDFHICWYLPTAYLADPNWEAKEIETTKHLIEGFEQEQERIRLKKIRDKKAEIARLMTEVATGK